MVAEESQLFDTIRKRTLIIQTLSPQILPLVNHTNNLVTVEFELYQKNKSPILFKPLFIRFSITFSEVKFKVIQSNKKEIQKRFFENPEKDISLTEAEGGRDQEDKCPEKQTYKSAHSFVQGSPSPTA